MSDHRAGAMLLALSLLLIAVPASSTKEQRAVGLTCKDFVELGESQRLWFLIGARDGYFTALRMLADMARVDLDQASAPEGVNVEEFQASLLSAAALLRTGVGQSSDKTPNEGQFELAALCSAKGMEDVSAAAVLMEDLRKEAMERMFGDSGSIPERDSEQ